MTSTQFYWAVIGEARNGGGVYEGDDWYVPSFQKSLANTTTPVHSLNVAVGRRRCPLLSNAKQKLKQRK